MKSINITSIETYGRGTSIRLRNEEEHLDLSVHQKINENRWILEEVLNRIINEENEIKSIIFRLKE
jgi:hypothetical protein